MNFDHCSVGYRFAFVVGCGDGPTTCPTGENCLPSTPKINPGCNAPIGGFPPGSSCIPSPKPTKLCPIANATCIVIFKKTVVKHVPVTQTTIDDANLFLVTSCMNFATDGQLTGQIAILCDTGITLMHNQGLAATIPQIDQYLKARGLLE